MKLKKLGLLSFCLALTACGGQQIDERQTEITQGLVYKIGDTEPFTGTVVHSKLRAYNTVEVGDCTIEYKKGLTDGAIICAANNGSKAFEAHVADEKRTGVEKHWNPQNGELVYEAHWSDGRKDGVEQSYDKSGKSLLQEIHWASGNKEGSERAWTADGTLLTDLNWKDGKRTGVFREIEGKQTYERHYKDDLFDGPNRVLENGSVMEETPFKMGRMEGIQTFYRFGEPEVVRTWSDNSVVNEAIRRHASKSVVYETDTITCDPFCPATIMEEGFARGIDATTMTNIQTQWPALIPVRGAYDASPFVDDADHGLDENGLGSLSNLMVDKPTLHSVQVDLSKIAKLETIFKSDKIDGLQRAWNAQGTIVLQVASQQGHTLTAAGSALPSEPIMQAGPGGVQIPSSGNTCLDDWEAAYHKEQGDDAVIAADQIDEWTEECKQEKTAPRN
jgi:antitoxin component YwqK of YwqJK toxin-antitoxin module